MKDLSDYSCFIDKYAGLTSFIVGAGTSLYGQDLSFIHDHVVISINSSILLMPWQDGKEDKRFWLSNDALVRQWSYWPLIKEAKCHKIVRESWKRYFDEIPDFYQFCPRRTNEGDINSEEKGLVHCSSVPSAIDLALQMGCNKIFLLGVDQYLVGEKHHFWDYWEEDKRPVFRQASRLPVSEVIHCFSTNDKVYPQLLKFAKTKKSYIYNCNLNSNVEVFPKISIQKAKELVK